MQKQDKKHVKKNSAIHDKKEQKKPDKKIKEKFVKIQKTNMPALTEQSNNDKNKMIKKKTALKINNKEDSKKLEQKSFEEKIKLNNNITIEEKEKENEKENEDKKEEIEIEGADKYEFNLYKHL